MQHIYCVFVLSDVSKNRLLCLCVTEKKDGMENPKRGRRQGAWQVRLHLLSNRSIVMAKFPSHLILSHSVCATHRRAHRWQKLDQSTPVSSSSSSKSSSLILPLLSSCVLLLYPPTAPLLLQTKVNTCQTDNQAWQMHSISRNTHSSYSQGSQKNEPPLPPVSHLSTTRQEKSSLLLSGTLLHHTFTFKHTVLFFVSGRMESLNCTVMSALLF